MDRVIRMLFRMVMRRGLRGLAAKGPKRDPNARRAQRSVKMANRIGRM